MQKSNKSEISDRGVYGTLTGIIYCPQSNYYVYMVNGDPVAIYDDKLIVNTSKCDMEKNDNDEIRMQVLKELIHIILDSNYVVKENLNLNK